MEAHEGETWLVPVFDATCPSLPDDNSPPCVFNDPPDKHGDDFTWVSNDNDYYFHVITFAAFHITCVDGPKNPSPSCDGHEAAVANGMPDNVFTIEGYFTTEFFETAGGTGEVFAGVYAISLIR